MARVPPLNLDTMPAASREILDAHTVSAGTATNMKRTLAHSPLALRVLLEWYPLRDEVAAFLGERRTLLFAHAISVESDCLICSTFFRRLLIDGGEDPERLQLDEWDLAIVAFGQRLARDPHAVSDELYAPLAERLMSEQIVTLTAFGALMLATNVFNDALRVDLDEYLWPYRGPAARLPEA